MGPRRFAVAANPTSLILSAAMLLDWRGRRDGRADLVDAAEAIGHAVEAVLLNPQTRTRDVGGALGTAGFTGYVVDVLRMKGGITASRVS